MSKLDLRVVFSKVTILTAAWSISTAAIADDTCTYLPEDVPELIESQFSLAGLPLPDVGRFLSVQSARNGQLSYSGEQMAFISNASGYPQIWVTNLDSSWPVQITFGEPITFFEWTPDNRLVYGVDRSGNEREGFYLISPDGLYEEELLAPSDAFRSFGGFSPNMGTLAYASTERDGISFDVHLFDLETKTDSRVFDGRMGLYVDSFSPDASSAVLTESSGEDANILFLFDVANRTTTPLFPDGLDRSRFDNIRWLADGSGFYLVTDFGREFAGIALYDVESGELSWEHQVDRDVDQLIFSEASETLAWTENHGGFSTLVVSRAGSLIEEVSNLPSGVYGIRIAELTGEIAVSISGPQVSGDIWLVDQENEVSRLTQSATAGLDMNSMIVPEHVSFTARDGVELYGQIYLPKEVNGDVPFLINVHGGPTAQGRPYFDAPFQYLLSRGIGIFDLNFRGSTGYGKSFARLNDGRLRENELYDLEDAANYLRQERGFSVSRVGITGGSYGGYLTMAAMSRLPGVFDVGVAQVGVSDWITALEGASPALQASDRIEYGDINSESDREFFRSISPVAYSDQVQAPIMLQHGANDPRDPPTESDHYACAVRAVGGEVEYVRFPDEGHGIRKQINRVTFYTRMTQFLKTHLGAE